MTQPDRTDLTPVPAPLTRRADRIATVLTTAFAPERLEVTDDSAHHAGHAGATPGGETHYAVTMVCAGFRGMNRVARSRAVHAALTGEFGAGLHALSLALHTPDEAERASS